MNPEKYPKPAEDAEIEAALRNFRLSVHHWSEQEYVRPRAIERTRWSRFTAGFWTMIANPALGGTLAAAMLIASVSVPVGIQYEHKVAAERQAALDLQQKQAEEVRKSAVAAASSAVDDAAFLDDVDSDIAQATPEAMQPLASLMNDAPAKSSRR
jgi:hypothetical protein